MHEYADKLQTVDYGVAATGTNNYEKKNEFYVRLRVNNTLRVEITSWSKVKHVKTPVIVDIFKCTNISPLKYCSALGLMYI